MDENKHQKEDTYLEVCPEASSFSGVSQNICLVAKNEEEKGMNDKYLNMIRYLLLKSLSQCPSSAGKLFYELENNEFCEIYSVANLLTINFFSEKFEKLREKRNEIESASEADSDYKLEGIKFLLSRCALLCPVPTYSNFVLVVAFLIKVVIMDIDVLDCYKTMYTSEFCLRVLHRRILWKIFQSENVYKNLKTFCADFGNVFIPKGSMATILWNNSLRENFLIQVQNCIEDTDISFPLEESEIEVFRNDSCVINNMEYNPRMSQEIENTLFSGCRKREMQSFCGLCHTKCHNYLTHISSFISL
ncbi:hypothetical protein TNCT_86181 [Trichonephila clavata]|uniref:Uncharacterized protein n=1 Tax=Trichonephila clavata TaxID=2740835 RepID=A0A8X6I9D1_TRICU|nr:hypothetical protein TNCT_86181 [Trichonephila clavata]